MSKFDYAAFENGLLAVSNERYTEQEAVEIAKFELGVNTVEKCDAFVYYGYCVDDDNELRNTWCLKFHKSKRCCPVWAFRAKED